MESLAQYDWQPQPNATAYVRGLVDELVRLSPAVQHLAEQLRDETGTRLFDWIDHVALPPDSATEHVPSTLGFELMEESGIRVWRHTAAMLPPLVEQANTRLAIKVESVADFVARFVSTQDSANASEIVGNPQSPCRAVCFARQNHVELCAIERHGYRGFDPLAAEPVPVARIDTNRKRFERRKRCFESDIDGFQHAADLIDSATKDIGLDYACDLFFAAERNYWQQRNHAARVQKARQDRLGLGWANHDHHTYRSSREHFHRLIAVLEQLGFTCRERFYAGREAGWGAQVLEQSACGVVIFADVDLAEDEVLGDFAHEPLAPRDELGTVGLWCKLHGEAFLEAGMHHLECQFDFDAARAQLANAGIDIMTPFTDFPYLRQAFTAGEIWPVESERIATALRHGWIDQQQADRFAAAGALGSHLEILERNDGYKGFNQTGISEIIKKTDPRTAV